MAKAQVINFPGDTTLDIDPDKVLEAAKGHLCLALVLGYREEGGLWCSSSSGDIPICNLLIDQIKQVMVSNLADLVEGED